MLKTVSISKAKKTGGIAVTYRSGAANKYGTCPADCELNKTGCGSKGVDSEYLDAVLKARPRRGFSFTYSHFAPLHWFHKLTEKTTVINWSAPSISAAVDAIKNKIPAVAVAPESYWQENGNPKHATFNGVKLVRCPAEYLENFGCGQCGGDDGPLCARLDRTFAILFTAHGASKKAAGDPDKKGGCYADGGNVNMHWKDMPDQIQDETDSEKLTRFVAGLPANAILRHHVAGDLGREELAKKHDLLKGVKIERGVFHI